MATLGGKQQIVTFKAEEALVEAMEAIPNRSEFIRDMIRQQLVGQQWQDDRETLGTVTLLYNHHLHKLSEKLTDLQHHHHRNILVSTHVHLDDHLCAEACKGQLGRVFELSDEPEETVADGHGVLWALFGAVVGLRLVVLFLLAHA